MIDSVREIYKKAFTDEVIDREEYESLTGEPYAINCGGTDSIHITGNPTGSISYKLYGGPYTAMRATCGETDDWSINFDNGYDEPTERVIHTNEGILVRCMYCNRRCPSDEYECAGCGAPT